MIVRAGEGLAARRLALELANAVWVVRDEPPAPHRRVHGGEAGELDRIVSLGPAMRRAMSSWQQTTHAA